MLIIELSHPLSPYPFPRSPSLSPSLIFLPKKCIYKGDCIIIIHIYCTIHFKIYVSHDYSSLKLLDKLSKNKITELLVLSKTVIHWQRYLQQRKSIRSGLNLWKKNASKRKHIRIKYNLIFLMLSIVIKWKRYVVGRKNLRVVVSLLSSSICSICYSDTPNFISRCKHTFAKMHLKMVNIEEYLCDVQIL